jgi:hypothetical protein
VGGNELLLQHANEGPPRGAVEVLDEPLSLVLQDLVHCPKVFGRLRERRLNVKSTSIAAP